MGHSGLEIIFWLAPVKLSSLGNLFLLGKETNLAGQMLKYLFISF